MKRFRNSVTSLITGLMLVSCVTINIYFPAAAAEKAADRIIEDIWGPEGQPKAVPEPEKNEQQSNTAAIGLAILDWVLPPAAAAEPLFPNIISPPFTAVALPPAIVMEPPFTAADPPFIIISEESPALVAPLVPTES